MVAQQGPFSQTILYVYRLNVATCMHCIIIKIILQVCLVAASVRGCQSVYSSLYMWDNKELKDTLHIIPVAVGTQ